MKACSQRVLKWTRVCKLQCEQPRKNTYVQNWLGSKHPSFAAAINTKYSRDVDACDHWTHLVTGSTYSVQFRLWALILRYRLLCCPCRWLYHSVVSVILFASLSASSVCPHCGRRVAWTVNTSRLTYSLWQVLSMHWCWCEKVGVMVRARMCESQCGSPCWYNYTFF